VRGYPRLGSSVGRATAGAARVVWFLPVTHVLPAAIQPAPVDLPAERAARRARARAAARAYLALTKPRIIELLLVTTVPAMLLAARGLPPVPTMLVTVLAGTLAAASANALNCYFDRDIDAVMRRTGQRPLAQHTVSPRSALVFGLLLGVVAIGWMWAATNLLAAALTLAAILFYVLVYTLGLKRRTAQNIVWGGAAGCMPVLIGWTAVTGSLAWDPVVLFGVVFFWTPPHFWALAMRFKDDYARAGVPMLPVVATPQVVARRIVGYTWATVAASLLLWPLATGWVYGVAALALGGWFLAQAYALRGRVRRAPDADPRAAASLRLFRASNSYLALLFLAVAVDALLR
jgi:heme o synthase